MWLWNEVKSPAGRDVLLAKEFAARSEIDVGPPVLPEAALFLGNGACLGLLASGVGNDGGSVQFTLLLCSSAAVVLTGMSASAHRKLAEKALADEQERFQKLTETVQALGGTEDERRAFLEGAALFPEEVVACWERIEPVLKGDETGELSGSVAWRMKSGSMARSRSSVGARSGWATEPWVNPVPLETSASKGVRSWALRLLLRGSRRVAR